MNNGARGFSSGAELTPSRGGQEAAGGARAPCLAPLSGRGPCPGSSLQASPAAPLAPHAPAPHAVSPPRPASASWTRHPQEREALATEPGFQGHLAPRTRSGEPAVLPRARAGGTKKGFKAPKRTCMQCVQHCSPGALDSSPCRPGPRCSGFFSRKLSDTPAGGVPRFSLCARVLGRSANTSAFPCQMGLAWLPLHGTTTTCLKMLPVLSLGPKGT